MTFPPFWWVVPTLHAEARASGAADANRRAATPRFRQPDAWGTILHNIFEGPWRSPTRGSLCMPRVQACCRSKFSTRPPRRFYNLRIRDTCASCAGPASFA